MFVSAYLVSLGFAESHAGEISEEVVSKHDDAPARARAQRGPAVPVRHPGLQRGGEDAERGLRIGGGAGYTPRAERGGAADRARRDRGVQSPRRGVAASQPGLAFVERRVARVHARQAEPGEQRALDVPGLRRGVATVPGGPEENPAQERLERFQPLSAPRRRKPRRGRIRRILDAGARAPRAPPAACTTRRFFAW